MMEEFLHTWKIDNYPYYLKKKAKDLVSPVFTADNIGKSRWYLKLHPRYRVLVDYVSLSLCRSPDCTVKESIKVSLEVRIGLSYSKPFVIRQMENCEFEKDTKFGFYNMIETPVLLDSMNNPSRDVLVICCKLMRNSVIGKSLHCCESRTELYMDRYILQCSADAPLDSSWRQPIECVTPHFSPVKITLICPTSVLCIQLHLKPEESSLPRFVKCTIAFLDINGKPRGSRTDSHVFKHCRVWDVLKIRKSFVTKEKGMFLSNGKLSLKLDVSIANGGERSVIDNYSNSKHDSSSIPTLLGDLKQLMIDHKYSDAMLKVDNELIAVHRGILAARSPVFKVLFEQNATGKQSGTLDITDMDVSTVCKFQEFIYTGKTSSMDYESALKLLSAGSKYQVSTLVEECSAFLIPSLSDENVCEVLSLADKVSHQQLKDKAMDYIRLQYRKVLALAEWKELCKDNIELASEVLLKASS